MAIPTAIFCCSSKPFSSLLSSSPPPSSTSAPLKIATHEAQSRNLFSHGAIAKKKAIAAAFGVGVALSFVGSASSAEFLPLGSSLLHNEPPNALSLPTWAIHVSSVVEWGTAMILVWQYGERSGYESWKGLSWGMVPLLGGALCACTWHFFYNAESLEVLVALQAALTVIGNATMCLAAFRIWRASDRQSKNL